MGILSAGKNGVVGVDVRMYHKSGIGRYIRSLLPGLINSTGYRYDLYGYEEDRGSFAEFPRAEFIPVTSRIYLPKEHIELARKIRPCDLYFSPHFIHPLFKIPAKRRVITVHDVFHISGRSIFNPLQKLYMKTLYDRCIRKADEIITVSEFSKSEIEKYFPHSRGKITVIPFYTDRSNFFILDKSARAEIKKQITANCGFDFSHPYILYVGNIKPHKNLLRLLEAFRQNHNRELYLLIVGEREGFIGREKDFDKKIEGIPRIVFTGKISDEMIRGLYNLAEFFIFPSYYEGFGSPPLEAMACGAPIAASDIPVLREVCGGAVFYFDPYSVDSIARAIDTLDSDPALRERLMRAGTERLGHFSPERNLRSHLEVLFKE
jgi:glycosyltransferase involved in cell wall biosynthesis